MDDQPRMQILQSFRQLIDDKSDMHFLEDALSDDIVEVGFHELKDKVDIFVVLCFEGLVEFYYVWVVELF